MGHWPENGPGYFARNLTPPAKEAEGPVSRKDAKIHKDAKLICQPFTLPADRLL